MLKPNILLITVDTLRFDAFTPAHMSKTYQWAEKNATIHTNCYAQSSWTRASYGSMLTGLMPTNHGSLRNCPTLTDVNYPTNKFGGL